MAGLQSAQDLRDVKDPREGHGRAESQSESDHDERVRARAYQIWLQEGRPEDRAEAHWDMACELVAIEENYLDTLKPNPTEDYARFPQGEPIEPIEAVRNLGEFPTLTDQGEEAVFPDRTHLAPQETVKDGSAAEPGRGPAPR